ncbi:MAG: hypothetical protein LAO51_20385, partial [Acidobacteriia bacterium]|nr:hypothetical protein [Terriglobia bacterium]
MSRAMRIPGTILLALLPLSAGVVAWTRGSVEVPVAPPEAVVDGLDPVALLADVSPQVEEIRGLRFKRPVAATVIDAAAARAYAAKRLRFLATAEDLDAEQSLYELLGLVPSGAEVVTEYLDVFDEQAGGFYDPTSKTFSLLGHMPRGVGPFLASHELTHALEDQYFDLDGRLAAARGNDDAIFALSAVHEGSATLVMASYAARAVAAGRLRSSDLEELQESDAGRGEKLQAMPPVLRRQLLGAYLLGATFLLRGRVGPIATAAYPASDVDLCYRDGPESSEQILHPEKYWVAAKRDRPRRIAVGDAGRRLGEGWRREGTGVLGELTLGCLVGAPTPSVADAGAFPGGGAWTNAAASGWGGDRWEVWAKGGRRVALLATFWDTKRDAEEFASALPVRPGLA